MAPTNLSHEKDSHSIKNLTICEQSTKSRLDGKISMFEGMDVHKNYMQIAVMDDKGKASENSRINNNNLEQVGEFLII